MDLDNQQIFKDFIIELQKQINIKKAVGVDIINCEDPHWTEMVQESFWEMGRIKRGITVYMTSHGGEYLLDVLWDSTEDKQYGPVLGLESEWGNEKDVEEDFYKLMYVKCKIKVLIYSSTSESNRIDLQQMIEHGLRNFNQHREGEHYLFLDISDFEPWVITVLGFIVSQSVLRNKSAVKLQKIGSANWDDKVKNYTL